MGIPREIITDQGTPFVSNLMKDLCKRLHIRVLRISVYHPQTDGLVEGFKTLKAMLQKVIGQGGFVTSLFNVCSEGGTPGIVDITR